MESLVRDFALAARVLRKRPGFTLVAVLSIALGIGFNTAIFSAANALLLRPVEGLGEPDRVVEVGRTNTHGGGFDTFSYPDFLDLRERVDAIEPLAAYRMVALSYGGEQGGERVSGMAVSPGYFEALGAPIARGRGFGPDEESRSGPPVAVVSHRFWQDRLGGDAGVVGSTIDINRQPFTVIGVTRSGFSGHMSVLDIEIFTPIARMQHADPNFGTGMYDERRSVWLMLVGRLGPGTSLDRANAEVDAVMASLAEAHPASNARRGARVIELGPVPGGGRQMVRGFLGILGGLVGLILLVTAANVAGMLLARGVARQKEIALRLAIGAGRQRLLRPLVAESLLLFLAGGAGGILLAWWGTRLLSVIPMPGPLSVTLDLQPDLMVVLFALGLALVCGLVFGLLPALQATRPDLVGAIREERRSGPRAGRMRRVFATVQVGLSLVLLICAGLFLRALDRAGTIEPGFRAEDAQVAWVDLALDGYGEEDGARFQRTVLDRLRSTPGIEAAAWALDLPMDLSENASPVWPEGRESPDDSGIGSDFNVVSDGYFRTLGIAVLRGRALDESDREGAPLVVVISRALAEAAWPGEDPIGRRLTWGGAQGELRTVVGVVADVKNQTLAEETDGMVYVPSSQRYTSDMHVVARGPAATPGLLRRQLLQADPRLAVGAIRSLEEVTGIGLLPQRIAAGLGTALGALALFLSALGVYGVIAFSVAQRRREMGVRMAVGATRRRILRLVLIAGLRLALPGLLVGTVLALAAGRLLGSLLFGLSPADPLTFAAVTLVLLGAVALASWVPAARAAGVDPIEALRSD